MYEKTYETDIKSKKTFLSIQFYTGIGSAIRIGCWC